MKIVLSGSMTVLVILLLSGCQANYIRDVQGGDCSAVIFI